jgi:predicted RNase H-like HicB family nuclease
MKPTSKRKLHPVGQIPYKIIWDYVREADGGYSVLARNWPGMATCGDDMAEAKFMAEDLGLLLGEMIREGETKGPSQDYPSKSPRGTVLTEYMYV